MQWSKRKNLAIALAAAILFAASGSAAWPQGGRTIRMILPFPPGGPADIMARLVAQQVGAEGGPTMVVESHPGAASEIGTELVSQAAPDGDTLGIISPSFVVLPHFRKLSYDPLKDFTPLCELATFPPLLVVNSQSPYHSLADLIDAAHARPSALTLGTIEVGSVTELVFEMLKRETKADITFVPFTGYTPAIEAVLGDHITAALADYSSLQAEPSSAMCFTSTSNSGPSSALMGSTTAAASRPLCRRRMTRLRTASLECMGAFLSSFSGSRNRRGRDRRAGRLPAAADHP